VGIGAGKAGSHRYRATGGGCLATKRLAIAGGIEKIEKNAISTSWPETPVITGGSVEFSTRSNPPKSENDVFVVLGGLQEKGSPL
jgi:hypothetical protein